MSIVIYTYSDPYHLPNEPFWEEIKTCPYFCASQTLVNGLKTLYGSDFQQGRVTTVQNLIEAIYPEWEGTAAMVKQHAQLDQIITHGVDQTLDSTAQQNLYNAFLFNREEVFNSVRVLFELNVNPREILYDKLTPEQELILKVYKTIRDSKRHHDFIIESDISEESIDNALNDAMNSANKQFDASLVPKETVVIHGIHQFTPIILRGIEQLSKYKRVILLFNYQPQFAEVYQTWIDIYSAFDAPIQSFSTPEFLPSLEYKQSYQGNLLADSLGRMINGNIQTVNCQDNVKILEFDNVTEFASYVAELYADAVKRNEQNPLHAMREQIYAADSSVNDILKMYFPEQFGERQFLNYPLGHFFIAIANMWDPQLNKVSIRTLNDIRECLEAGILPEETPGELASIFGKVSALFEDCTNINEMVSRIKKIQRIRKFTTDQKETELAGHVSYFNVASKELDLLKQALMDLNELATYFYEDFEETAHNFREFYKKLRAYIQDQAVDADKLGEQYADIMRRVLERLEEVESIDASASFECLKATMNIYLVQETKPGKGANWIVRNFEQIDGDILRSLRQPDFATYHFACLTDEDINSVKRREFTWPLDADFFEVAQEPVDWKYQVYVKSRKEYKNFRRYALIYGLEFNRAGYKLSYVKRDDEKDQTLYSLLKILGCKVVPYKSLQKDKVPVDCSHIQIDGYGDESFTEYDYYRYRICRYRFLNEAILENNTVYKDAFLLGKYMEVWLENKVRLELEGMPISEIILTSKLNNSFDELKRYFPFVQNVNRMDMINNVRNRMMNGTNKTIPKLTDEQRRYMKIRELFIHKVLSDPRTHRKDVFGDKFTPVSADQVTDKLSSENLTNTEYFAQPDVWCQYCADRELCAACYSIEAFKEA